MKSFHTDPIRYATELPKHSELLRLQGRLRAARSLCRRALARLKKFSPSDDPSDLAEVFQTAASTYEVCGDYREAHKLYLPSLRVLNRSQAAGSKLARPWPGQPRFAMDPERPVWASRTAFPGRTGPGSRPFQHRQHGNACCRKPGQSRGEQISSGQA